MHTARALCTDLAIDDIAPCLQWYKPSSWKKTNELKYTEAEMRWRAAQASSYRRQWYTERYKDEMAAMRDTAPPGPGMSQRVRKQKLVIINRELSKLQNKWGVRSMPVFAALGYFRYVHESHTTVHLHGDFQLIVTVCVTAVAL